MKNLIELLKELETKHDRTDKLLLNITYYLIKNYYVCKSIKNLDIYDLMLMYDNLEYNNEIITGDNIDQYNKNYLNITNKTYQEIKDYKKLLLLNFYKINGSHPTPCKIKLDYIDDRLIY